jgi:Fur family transcriptional regulator, ferric uptake regulator
MILILSAGYDSGMSEETQAPLAERLRRKGVRPTRQRLAVLEALEQEPNDATAQELWRRLRERDEQGLGLATVYRTLAVLRDHGVVDVLAHHDDELCYRLCTDAHHHHLVCTRCHRVVELADCGLDEWIEGIAERNGFADVGHRLELAGVCASCRG